MRLLKFVVADTLAETDSDEAPIERPGPPLGGFLVDNASWNWAFEINLVPGTIAAVVLFLLLRDPEAKRELPVDAVGLALLAVTLGTLCSTC